MPSSDATLSSLVVAGGTIVPAFNPSLQGYSVSFPAGTTDVFITLTKNDTGATIKYNGSTVTSGAPVDYGVVDGVNYKEWIITAADGSQLVYVLVVNVGSVTPTGPLTLAFSAVQSADGTTVTITDKSNWVGNTSGYTENQFVKSFVMTDYLGNPIATIQLATGVYVATYTIPAGTNPWINIQFNAVSVSIPLTLTLTQMYAFYRIFQLAYIAANKASCGCKNLNRVDMCQVDTMLQVAQWAIPIADAADYQNNINAAYKLLAAA